MVMCPFIVTKKKKKKKRNIKPRKIDKRKMLVSKRSITLLDNRIYIPSAGNLCTCILQYNHDHILAGYFDQNKTLELVCHRYS